MNIQKLSLQLFLVSLAFQMMSCGNSDMIGKDTVLDFEVRNIDTNLIHPEDLSNYKGNVVLIVNTATECGYTPQ